MRRLISPDKSFEEGEFYWARITSFLPGATFGIDGQRPFAVDALAGYIADRNGKPWKRFDVTGTITVELSDDPREEYPGPPNPPAGAAVFGFGVVSPITTISAGVAGNTAFTFAVNGGQYGYLDVAINSPAGGNSYFAEYSFDNGFNWRPMPKAFDSTVVTPNPATFGGIDFVTGAAISFATGAGLKVYKFPLPGRTTQFRLRLNGAAVQTETVTFTPFSYAPGIAVVAVLVDFTTAVATAGDSGTVDTADWSQLLADFISNGGAPAYSAKEVDETGTSLANLNTSAADFTASYGAGCTVGGVAGLVAAPAQIMLPRRMRFQSAAIAAQTSRLRLTARR